MQVVAAHLPVYQLQAGKFNQAVAVVRVKSGGFSIEDNLTLAAHGAYLYSG